MAELIGGEHARYQKTNDAHRHDRETLRIGGRTVGPPRRDGLLVHHAFHTHARHHRHQYGESYDQSADEGVVGIDGRARSPEDQRRKEQPHPDSRIGPLRPAEAGRQGECSEAHDQ